MALLHDRAGQWRDEVLVSTRVGLDAATLISEYGKRWSIEVAFRDSKQFLGLQDPQVRTERSVERAHPLAWFCLSLTLLWYALHRDEVERVQRDRRWYRKLVGETFADMLGALRLRLWQERLFGEGRNGPVSREMVRYLLNEMAAVG